MAWRVKSGKQVDHGLRVHSDWKSSGAGTDPYNAFDSNSSVSVVGSMSDLYEAAMHLTAAIGFTRAKEIETRCVPLCLPSPGVYETSSSASGMND
jgi:hypothetical protein